MMMNIKEIAARAGVCRETVQRDIRKGNLRVIRIGLGEYDLNPDDVYHWIRLRCCHPFYGPKTAEASAWLKVLRPEVTR
jgi:excisionase family DNA binding protein